MARGGALEQEARDAMPRCGAAPSGVRGTPWRPPPPPPPRRVT